jgi:hypothetical protein
VGSSPDTLAGTRGADDKQASMFSIVSPEKQIPVDHPLRSDDPPSTTGPRGMRATSSARKRTQLAGTIVAAAYNMLRICRLLATPT